MVPDEMWFRREGMDPFPYGFWGSTQTPKIKADLDWELQGNWAGPQRKGWRLARQVHCSLVLARWSPQSHSDLSFAIDLLCGLKPVASLSGPLFCHPCQAEEMIFPSSKMVILASQPWDMPHPHVFCLISCYYPKSGPPHSSPPFGFLHLG